MKEGVTLNWPSISHFTSSKNFTFEFQLTAQNNPRMQITPKNFTQKDFSTIPWKPAPSIELENVDMRCLKWNLNIIVYYTKEELRGLVYCIIQGVPIILIEL